MLAVSWHGGLKLHKVVLPHKMTMSEMNLKFSNPYFVTHNLFFKMQLYHFQISCIAYLPNGSTVSHNAFSMNL